MHQSPPSTFQVHTWKKRQCFVGMAEAVLQQETSYQRWTNFKWADVIRLTVLTRVFTQHFLPNSNADATKLGITNPEAWSRREEAKKVAEKKVVKQAIIPPPEKTAASSNFIISLVSSSDDEEAPAGTDTAPAAAPAAPASVAADYSADTSSPVGKKKKRGSCLENGCAGFLKTGVPGF